MSGFPERAELLTMLAAFGDRRPEQVSESIDSMELAWLLHQVEERYGRRIDLDDAVLARMTSVSGAAEALRDHVFEPADD